MTGLLTLHSNDSSLVLEMRAGRPPLWRHLGASVDELEALPSLSQLRTSASFSLDEDFPLSCLPGSELGWLGPKMFVLRGDDGAEIPFRPSTVSCHQDEGEITIAAQCGASGLALTQKFSRMVGGAFLLSLSLQNSGAAPLRLTLANTAILPLYGPWDRIISWEGRHNGELNEHIEPLPAQGWMRETRRGISGHGGPPGVYILSENAGDHTGLVLAAQLAWSGDSAIRIARDDEGYHTLSLGLAGDIVLKAGEEFTLPHVILALSAQGRNGAAQQQHAAIRQMLNWPGGKMASRKVHLNSWEACYFAHDEARILELARAAASIGAERFVLDDGWFKGRNDDTSSLGDWTADPVKYPQGLGPLARAITELGLEFGLWVEPEMVNPNSDLYRAHPDWALAESATNRPTARGQLVLDMRREDVREYLFTALDKLLKELPISYLKWDHNRDHAPSGGPGQVLGTYALLARLRAAHPDVEIEGCAGGGGRSDAGLIPYVHRFWTSDNVDALSRISMQRGFLAFLPPEIMGAHIGASPCHATSRTQALPFRAAIASMGHLGVEMDPDTLDDDTRSSLSKWIGFYKQHRDLLHSGEVIMGHGADGILWQAHGNGAEFLLFVIRPKPALHRRPQPLPLPFAAGSNNWEVKLLELAELGGAHVPRQSEFTQAMMKDAQHLSGAWLSANGLPLPVQQGESVAIFHLKASNK